jgi:SAM-dependent methyltransferase
MPRRLNLPDSASVAHPSPDGRLFAPSTQRNVDAIGDLLAEHLPPQGRMLEIAAGTGEHAVAFALRFPATLWLPTDIDDARLSSIAAHRALANAPNLAEPAKLDATSPGWGASFQTDAVLIVNLLHLISEVEAKVLLKEAATALAPGGLLFLYGPFLRDGETTSEGDASFHASLSAQDPEIGYKDDWDVIEWIHQNWLELVQVVEMPANNLAFIARKP